MDDYGVTIVKANNAAMVILRYPSETEAQGAVEEMQGLLTTNGKLIITLEKVEGASPMPKVRHANLTSCFAQWAGTIAIGILLAAAYCIGLPYIISAMLAKQWL